ncbi:ferredoxin [Streptomyces sp. NBC_00669]|uniref:ferredoxin n=1 Tax=unclassified Streptomyces TaxID=2593676 RepID=UPI002E2F1592|nr:ferredoxin [Streptomyces sp. NBC_00669]
MRIHVDQDKCCGSGMCVLAAPEVFDQRDADGIVELLDPKPPQTMWADVRDAAAGCPSWAIEVDET